MGLDADTMQPLRDEAVAGHKSYWEQNGGSPNPDSYFPGFESGWNAVKAKVEAGEEVPGDIKDWAAQSANGQGWEWEHGFIAGAEKAIQNK